MKTKNEKLEGLLESLEKITDDYKKQMQNIGYYEMKVKQSCLLYLDKHRDSKHGIEKLEMIACCENTEVRELFLQLTKLRANRKIYEKSIEAFQTSISGLQSLIKFESPV